MGIKQQTKESKMTTEKKEEKYLLSEDSTEQQFQVLLDAYGIDLEYIKNAYPDIAAATEYRFGVFKNFIRRGLIEIITKDDQDVCIKQNLKPAIGDKTSIVYGPYTGATNVAKSKDGPSYATQLCNALGSMSKLGASFFGSDKIKMLNARVADEIFTFFRNEF
jgi:hypothetical protein